MDDPLIVVGTVVIVLGMGAVFLLSLAEASLLAINDITLRRLVEQGNRRARIVQQLRAGQEYLSAVIVGVNTSVIVVATMATVLLKHAFGNTESLPAELWHVGLIASILVFAELTPKTWGSLAPVKTALWVAPTVARLTAVSRPFVRLITSVSHLFVRPGDATTAHRTHFVTAAEIQAAADIGEEEGVVEREEGEMLDSVIELQDTVARAIMVPRVDIVAVPRDATIQQVVGVAVESGHSRIPVYEDSIDRITGILYVADLLHELRDGHHEGDVASLTRQPVYVPETKKVDELFRELRDRQVHIAIVLDEFGGTEGLVTIEDILEELVGDIEDEHDAPEDDIFAVSETEALVDGNTRIAEANERLGLELPEDEYETVGGLVAGRMGRIPQVGESVREGPVELIVEQGTEQHVERLRIVKTEQESGEV